MKQSQEINELAAALVSAQSEFTPAIKGSVNPHFKSKYADLGTAIEAAQPALLKHGIAVLQGAEGDIATSSIGITTRLLHKSGQWIEDTLTLPAANRDKFDAQSVGSAITYGRRYAYMAMLGFAAEDDDGNAASAKPEVQRLNQQLKQSVADPADIDNFLPPSVDQGEADYHKAYRQHQSGTGGPISEAQSKRLFAIAMSSAWTKDEYNDKLKEYGYDKNSPIQKSHYEELCSWAGRQ